MRGLHYEGRIPREPEAPEAVLHNYRVVRSILVLGATALFVASVAMAAPSSTRKPTTKPSAGAKSATGSRTTTEAGKETTVLYGDNHMFAICAPQGWVIDDTSGMGSKIRVVLYPKGNKWASSSTVMYANPLHQDVKRPKPIRAMIDRDVVAFRKSNPAGVVLTGPRFPTATEKKAEVRFFSHDGGKPHEAVAYVAEDELVMLLVLSARTADDFAKALPAFQLLVRSYNFVGTGLSPF